MLLGVRLPENKAMGSKLKVKGSFKHTNTFLTRLKNLRIRKVLEHYGDVGVAALSNATPVDTGLTADSWYYEIDENQNGLVLRWNNRNVSDGVNIAIILQYGHGTRNGGYVVGIDYINPVVQPIMDEISKKIWEEVK